MNDAPIIYRYGLRYPHEGDKAIIVDMATNEVMFKGDIVARLNELETQLATEREAKQHETERAQTLMRERDAALIGQSQANEGYEYERQARILAMQQRGAAREDARVQREALQLVLKWKDETLEPMRQKAMDVSLAHEPCGYYCDESVGHVDHTLFNWAKYLYGDGVAPDIWEKVDAAIGTKYLKDGELR